MPLQQQQFALQLAQSQFNKQLQQSGQVPQGPSTATSMVQQPGMFLAQQQPHMGGGAAAEAAPPLSIIEATPASSVEVGGEITFVINVDEQTKGDFRLERANLALDIYDKKGAEYKAAAPKGRFPIPNCFSIVVFTLKGTVAVGMRMLQFRWQPSL